MTAGPMDETVTTGRPPTVSKLTVTDWPLGEYLTPFSSSTNGSSSKTGRVSISTLDSPSSRIVTSRSRASSARIRLALSNSFVDPGPNHSLAFQRTGIQLNVRIGQPRGDHAGRVEHRECRLIDLRLPLRVPAEPFRELVELGTEPANLVQSAVENVPDVLSVS